MGTIGSRVKALRAVKGWKQAEAAKNIGIAQPSLSDIENDVSTSLRGETLASLCRAFHTTAEFVMYGAQDTDDPELPLIESEVLYILRALSPDARQSVLASARGIFNQFGERGPNNPFPQSAAPGVMKKRAGSTKGVVESILPAEANRK